MSRKKVVYASEVGRPECYVCYADIAAQEIANDKKIPLIEARELLDAATIDYPVRASNYDYWSSIE